MSPLDPKLLSRVNLHREPLKPEQLSRVNQHTVMTRMVISSNNIAPKVINDGIKPIFAYDEEMLPFQREAKSTELNKTIVCGYMNFQEALDSGVDYDIACNHLPSGILVLATEPEMSYEDSYRFMVIDGRQRLACLHRAAKNLSTEIQAPFHVDFIENMSVECLADQFVRYNSRNPITQPELINAAFHYKAFDNLMEKINISKEKGHLFGLDITPKNNGGNIKNSKGLGVKKKFPLHMFLSMAFYGITKKNTTEQMIKYGNDISQDGVDSLCLMLSLFEKTIGHKSFRENGNHKNKKDCYSSSSYMASLARLVLNHSITTPTSGQLTAKGLEYFMNLLTDYDEGKGYEYHEFALAHNTGGKKTFDEIYSSWTKCPRENSRAMGIQIGVGKHRIWAREGHAINENLNTLEEGCPLRIKIEESRA